MKAFLVSAAATLCLIEALPASGANSCAALSGQWYGGVLGTANSGPIFDLQDVQAVGNGKQTFTGTYNIGTTNCTNSNGTVAGTMNSDGSFQLTVTWPQNGGLCGSGTEAITGTFTDNTSCSQLLVTYPSSGNEAFHRASCPVPNSNFGSQTTNGEGPSIFVAWLGVAGRYQATIKPPINTKTGVAYTFFNWTGRSPTESFSNPVNTCFPTRIGTPIPGPVFPISNANEITDDIGMETVSGLDSVRLSDTLPCSLTFQQTMSIDCYQGNPAGTVVPYETHPLLIQINPSTMTVQRNSTPTNPANEPAGVSQSGYRTLLIVDAAIL